MSGARLSIVLAIAAIAVLLTAPAAGAGTFSYGQPGSFTTTTPGANPDHDAYGGRPWSYVESGTDRSHNPAGFARLPNFATGLDGALAGWTDTSDANPPIAGAVPGGSSATGTDGDVFASGQLILRPASDRVVAVGWTSPFSQAVSVTIKGTVTSAAASGACGLVLSNYSWNLEQNGTSLQGGNGPSPATITPTTTTVPAGGTVYLTIDYSGFLNAYNGPCDTAQATLVVQAVRNTAPTVSVTSPVSGALFTGTQPTFSGTASTAYGSSNAVTVRVFSGGAPTGTPTETLPTTASGGSWSVAPNPALPDGLYTVVAEQDDLASPSDAGTSPPVTFRVSSPVVSPTLVVQAPPRNIFTTGAPTLTGSAGSGGAGQPVTLLVYPGTSTASTPVRYLPTTAATGSGAFSVAVSPSLDDGLYTIVATQDLSGTVSVSKPVIVLVKANAPALTMIVPASGGQSGRRPLFLGLAGADVGDAATVSLALYAGASTVGRPLRQVTVARRVAGWAYTWSSSLRLGLYTVVVTQADAAGHVATAGPRTFLVVPSPSIVGGPLSVAQNGTTSIPVYCPARYGSVCSGTVTVVTASRIRMSGRAERLTLIRLPVVIAGASTMIVRSHLPRNVRRALLRARHLSVDVTVTLAAGGRPATYTARRRAVLAR